MEHHLNIINQESFLENINDAIDYLDYQFFDSFEAIQVRSILCNLKNWKNITGKIILLWLVGNSLSENGFWYLSIFLTEQLLIEKIYLSNHHLYLVHTLHRIRGIYIENDQSSQTEEYLLETMTILNKSNKKGTLYRQTMYYLGLVKFKQSLCNDAFEWRISPRCC